MSKNKTEEKVVTADSMQGEFAETRAFLRSCMAGVVTGEVNHQKAKDVALLAQQQNYNMALQSTMFPNDARGISSSQLLQCASRMMPELEHESN